MAVSDYKIVRNGDVVFFEKEILRQIAEGYELQGSPFLSYSPLGSPMISQAMIKTSEETEKDEMQRMFGEHIK
jgi:hypothetical protein